MEKMTYSVALAIRFMLDLTLDGESYIRERCPALKPAVWSNFIFFRRIRPLPIRKLERFEPTGDNCHVGYWTVERDIEFYKRDQLIGVVSLRGEKFDTSPDIRKRCKTDGLDPDGILSAWAVSHVWYYRFVGGGELLERIETDVPYSSLSSGQI